MTPNSRVPICFPDSFAWRRWPEAAPVPWHRRAFRTPLRIRGRAHDHRSAGRPERLWAAPPAAAPDRPAAPGASLSNQKVQQNDANLSRKNSSFDHIRVQKEVRIVGLKTTCATRKMRCADLFVAFAVKIARIALKLMFVYLFQTPPRSFMYLRARSGLMYLGQDRCIWALQGITCEVCTWVQLRLLARIDEAFELCSRGLYLRTNVLETTIGFVLELYFGLPVGIIPDLYLRLTVRMCGSFTCGCTCSLDLDQLIDVCSCKIQLWMSCVIADWCRFQLHHNLTTVCAKFHHNFPSLEVFNPPAKTSSKSTGVWPIDKQVLKVRRQQLGVKLVEMFLRCTWDNTWRLMSLRFNYLGLLMNLHNLAHSLEVTCGFAAPFVLTCSWEVPSSCLSAFIGWRLLFNAIRILIVVLLSFKTKQARVPSWEQLVEESENNCASQISSTCFVTGTHAQLCATGTLFTAGSSQVYSSMRKKASQADSTSKDLWPAVKIEIDLFQQNNTTGFVLLQIGTHCWLQLKLWGFTNSKDCLKYSYKLDICTIYTSTSW